MVLGRLGWRPPPAHAVMTSLRAGHGDVAVTALLQAPTIAAHRFLSVKVINLHCPDRRGCHSIARRAGAASLRRPAAAGDAGLDPEPPWALRRLFLGPAEHALQPEEP